jgi:hypothetical protein
MAAQALHSISSYVHTHTTSYITLLLSGGSRWPCDRVYGGKNSSSLSDWPRFDPVQVANHRGETGLTSTSLDRAPGPSKNFVRGKSGYVPFWPGGLDVAARDNDGVDALISGEKGMRTVAPGLSRGMRLPGEVVEEDFFELPDATERPLAVGSLLAQKPSYSHNVQNGVESFPTVDLNDLKSNGVSDIDEFLPVSVSEMPRTGNPESSDVIACQPKSSRNSTSVTESPDRKARLGSCSGHQQEDEQLSRTCTRYGT